MQTYLLIEAASVQAAHILASGRYGKKITVPNLSAAKQAASRSQHFQGTVLAIFALNGAAIAIKEDEQWRVYEDGPESDE
jgi:hypothetical protein